jgi:two-component system, chemotaxis family, chemotaxis protein CheY
MKVLSVDDSAMMRKIIRGAVDTLGYDFLEAVDGVEALEVIDEASNDVDLILLDWNMPRKDGFETLVALKNDPNTQNIPVMMVTTEAEKGQMVKALQAGAHGYLTKPFSQQDLMTRMMACLGQAEF